METLRLMPNVTLDSKRSRFSGGTAGAVITVLCVAIIAVGCDSSTQSQDPTTQYSSVGPVIATPQREGDPEAGKLALLEKPYVSCGIPARIYNSLAGGVSGEVLAGRRGANQSLPYSMTASTTDDGVEIVSQNCLTCHASRLFGEIVIGLGDETLDFTSSPLEYVNQVGKFVVSDKETNAFKHWASRLKAIAPFMQTETVGVNPANNLTLALVAHLDPTTLAWSDEPLMTLPPTQPLPVSVPPWWRMRKKTSLFYTTEGRGDHARLMMTAAILCVNTLDEVKEFDTYAPDIRAYIASLTPPPYPFDIDRALASTGQAVFERSCSGCHGTYGTDWSYPNLVLPLEVIATDPELAHRSTQESDRFITWYTKSYFGEIGVGAPAPGYIAPPLDGVWATAPYLHNGSVPTIAVLLDSKERPAHWLPNTTRSEYDQAALGWRVETISQADLSLHSDKTLIYDTTKTGYSNQGHNFGDALSNDDRQAVLEYLKTL